jgi:hypothetical protein
LIYQINHETDLGELTEKLVIMVDTAGQNSIVSVTALGELGLFQKMKAKVFGVDRASSAHKQLDDFLDQLANYTENLANQYAVSVAGIAELEEQPYLYSSTAVSAEFLDQTVNDMVARLKNFMQKHNLRADGKPFLIYERNIPPAGEYLISVGLPIDREITVPNDSRILVDTRPAARAVKVELAGNTKYNAEAWTVAKQHAQKKGYQRHSEARPFEVREITALESINPSEFLTLIYWLIEEDTESEDASQMTLETREF